jgi:predicted PurR-regulated permease PerM
MSNFASAPLSDTPSNVDDVSAVTEPVRDVTVASPSPVPLRVATNGRDWALALIALLGLVYTLRWAGAIIIPLLLGLMCSYALSPVVDLLHRWRIPRAIGAAALLLAAVGGLGFMAFSLSDDASALIDSLPDAAQKLGNSLRADRGAPEGAIEKVQRAATSLEDAADDSRASAPLPAAGVTRVQVERPRFNVSAYLWTGTLGLAGLVGQALAVLFVAFFLLASGDTFRRKLAKVAGPTLKRKKATVQVLDEITAQMQRYLIVQTLTSVLVGLATWAAFAWIGLAHAAVWGVAAAVLNLVPYIGAIVVSGGAALVSFLQFETLGMALLVGSTSLLIQTLEGNLLTPWLTSRASRMSPVVVFVGVLAWGWLWGIWGLLLGAPLLIVIKAICDRVEALQPIGELLGE